MNTESNSSLNNKLFFVRNKQNVSRQKNTSRQKYKYWIVIFLIIVYTLTLLFGLFRWPFLQKFIVNLTNSFYDIEFRISTKIAEVVKDKNLPYPSNSNVSMNPTIADQDWIVGKKEIIEFISPSGTRKVIVNTDDIPHEFNSVYGINDAKFSPDESKIMIYVEGSLSLPILYYSSATTIDFQYIDWVVDAAWSNNSRYIAYTSKPADAGAVTILGVYDTETKREVPIINRPYIENLEYDILSFGSMEWLADDSGIRVNYAAIKFSVDDPDPGIAIYGRVIKEGEIILPLEIN